MITSLPILILDVYGRCNCRCLMCDIWKRTVAPFLRPSDFVRQLPAIERLGVQWVVLTGGEPLMHPALPELCAPLKDRGIRITLLTTGLLLDRFAEQVCRDIDDVIVSLDGPPEVHNRIRGIAHAFERLSNGIRALQGGRAVSARSTVQRSNFAYLSATVKAARALGCRSISFLAADTHSTAFNHQPAQEPGTLHRISLTPAELDGLAEQIERLIQTGECGNFIAESPEKLRRIVAQMRGSAGFGDPVAPACNAPWVSAVIDAGGAVRPCFFHPPIGTIACGTPLDQVLNAPDAIAFRGGLNIAEDPICRRCVCSLNWKRTASFMLRKQQTALRKPQAHGLR